MMYNCDKFADVDFGHGLVEIRCTMTGEHERCRCVVDFMVEKKAVEDSNVFGKESAVDIGPEVRR